jgi:hypothetical protein
MITPLATLTCYLLFYSQAAQQYFLAMIPAGVAGVRLGSDGSTMNVVSSQWLASNRDSIFSNKCGATAE